MSFGKIGILLSKMFTAVQSIEPTGSGLVIFEKLGWVLIWIWEGICLGIYNIIRWLLALVDFMQYFVQKLIGLDYWLNRNYYTLEGAIESDLIFGFLYNDTVQKVFRAMMGIFFVLLIIFTIYAIIKSEWDHINGTGKGGKFGDGTGNSKTRIFRNSMKAVALVLIFPIILMVGIISANAILASLIKALNIDTSSTLGGQLFQIASQNANKYEKYAHDTDGRAAVSDEVSFYVKNNKYITLGSGGSTDVVTMVDTYEDYLKEIAGATKYTVRSCFDRIGGIFDQGYDKKNFYGYVARLTVKGEPFFIMATCAKSDDSNVTNCKSAMYYYLRCVLQVPIVNKYDAYGFGGHSIVKEYMNSDPDWGFISGANLNDIGFDDVEDAMRNTWNYASIYKETYAFEDSLDYMVTRKGGIELSSTEVTGGDGKSLLDAANLGVSSAKVMFNSPLVSAYFDGGERGIVQMQSEYLVMAEVIDFINQNNFRLHILDINSPLISWAGEGSYKVENKWINPSGIDITNGSGGKKHTIPFIIGYSDSCNETEMGNVLYFGDDVGGNQSELKGAKYIMCIKVEGKSNAKYIPLVNNKTYTDPVTGNMYNFKSSYYSASYQGVVLAKGLLDSSATNAYRGEPTYFVSSTKTKPTLFDKDGDFVGDNDPYYYEMVMGGGFNQFAETGDFVRSYDGKNGDPDTGYDFRVDGITCSLSAANYYYDLRRFDVDGDTTYEKEIYKVYKVSTDENAAPEDKESVATPSADIIRSLQVQLKNRKTDPYDMVTAEYGGQSTGNRHLFKFSYEGFAYYFMLEVDSTAQTVSVLTFDDVGGADWEVLDIDDSRTHPYSYGVTLNALTRKYYIKYDFDQDGDVAYNVSLNGTVGFTPDYFGYAKTVTKRTGTNSSATKAVYQTIDMESFSVGDTDKTLYFNIAFNTTSKYLVTIGDDGNIKFAEAYEPSAQEANSTGMSTRGSDPFVQSSSFAKFYLYDFYHGYLGTENATTHIIEGAVREYDPEKSGTDGISDSAADRPDEDDDDWFFECKVDSDDFSFPAKESYIHLYDGNRYVATIYKVAGNDPSNAIPTIGQLPTATTYILYNDTIYYNIRTQNAFKTEGEMGTYFDNVKQSMVIRCVRDNRSMIFFDFEFFPVTFIPSLKMRINLGFFTERLEREWIGQEFYITDGIQFDYFFEGKASLITFYIPSKISYWIILVASALMIKVLGTAIWGVIKRIYEITLFFIAAPAVASTIPLDDGQKFTTQIQQPLVRKVLGTYGTMLGINVFFILLYPVKSLSQIFTPEDIATSNNYFLKNFFSIFGREFQAKMLNMYVYILFVLVAFTMISALPGVIAQMLGAEDVHKNGEQTKKQAASDVKGA
ncbi:MAG: hypothetical protein IJA23_04270, partial [Clostridia bacterium]|nr:hypothetical protein [Clostridia bacterium]